MKIFPLATGVNDTEVHLEVQIFPRILGKNSK
jgi:hypothetical protein